MIYGRNRDGNNPPPDARAQLEDLFPDDPPQDPRREAWDRLLEALDTNDTPGAKKATLDLRRMNFSILVLSPRGQGGRG